MPPTAIAQLRREIVADLRKTAGRPPRERPAEGQAPPITSYGLKVPGQRAMWKRWAPRFAQLTITQRLALAKALLASRVQEEGHFGIAALRGGQAELTPAHYDKLDALVDDFSSWHMCDDFASGKGSVTEFLLRRYPKKTLRLLRRWNTSPNLWKRRISVITFTRALAESGDFLDESLRLCEALEGDPEDLVQKGVGWALKDSMRAGPAAKRRVVAIVKRMRREGVPATITLYAIRDLRGAERDAILRVKSARSGARSGAR